jgi:hypothetical protein
MDILAHTLWAGAGVIWLARRRPLARRTVAATIAAAGLPDTFQMLPLLAWWWFGGGSLEAVRAYALAVPGQEPVMPALMGLWSHHLHCTAHSAVVAGGVTLMLRAWRRGFWLPLLGWWSHILIDVFTHSADYYASPVLYPFTRRGFDGVPWNAPWFMVLNYLALLAVFAALWKMSPRRRAIARPGPSRRTSRHGSRTCGQPGCGHASVEADSTQHGKIKE